MSKGSTARESWNNRGPVVVGGEDLQGGGQFASLKRQVALALGN